MKVPPTQNGRGTGGMHFIEFDYSFSLALAVYNVADPLNGFFSLGLFS